MSQNILSHNFALNLLFCIENKECIQKSQTRRLLVLPRTYCIGQKSTSNAQNFLAQIVSPNPKVWDFDEKGIIGRPLGSHPVWLREHFDLTLTLAPSILRPEAPPKPMEGAKLHF